MSTVRVYRNLRNRKFSVQLLDGSWKVVAHLDSIYLESARFIVRQSGRELCLRKRQKNVHAYIEGIWIETPPPEDLEEVTYNPYLYGYFYRVSTLEPVLTADWVYLANRKAYIDKKREV